MFFLVLFFRYRYDAAGEFQAYPPEVSGGSIMIIRGETKTAAEFAEFIAKRKKMSPEKIKKVRQSCEHILLFINEIGYRHCRLEDALCHVYRSLKS